MGTHFTDFTGSTPLSQFEVNRRLYQLNAVINQIKDGNYYGASTEITISAGAATLTGGYHTIAAEGAPTTDNLDTINGTIEGQQIALQAASGDTITLRHGVGNIQTQDGADAVMSGSQIFILLDNGTDLIVTNTSVSQMFAEFVGHTTFAVAAANIDLASIPATAAHLVLVMGLRSDNVSNRDGIHITFNADTGANYWRMAVEENLGATAKSQGLTQNEIRIPNGAAANSATANYVGVFRMTIFDYLNVARPRHINWQNYVQFNDSSGNLYTGFGGGIWKNTVSAIDQITIAPETGANWDEGFYALYGMGAAE